jgi:hypothetical protein
MSAMSLVLARQRKDALYGTPVNRVRIVDEVLPRESGGETGAAGRAKAALGPGAGWVGPLSPAIDPPKPFSISVSQL